jgi:SAM-dependent methyltransferase
VQRYDPKFYDDLRDTALPAARRVVPVLRDLMAVASVVDVGCGDGSWLAGFRETGTARILGIDGDWVAADQLLIDPNCFRRMSLDGPIGIGERFDLAVSLEVAEHLPAENADRFVAELCRLAPVVLFSAAIPFQGGLNHFNEQWPDYWATRFDSQGYYAIDALRLSLWEDPGVAWWYKQNLLLFASEDALAANPKLAEAYAPGRTPPRLVHPDRYLMAIRDARPSFGKWLRRGPPALRASIAKRFGR